MRVVTLEQLKPDIVLSKPVLNSRGIVLIGAGVPLTAGMVTRLKKIQVGYVYVEDERTNGIDYDSPISEETKRNTVNMIESSFLSVLQAPEKAKIATLEKSSKQFTTVVRKMMDELKENKEAVSLLTDVCAHDDYIFTHSFNVTLFSLALGIELKLSQKDLEILGMGAMLHDVGKMCIPLEILTKPARLTPEEYEVMKTHSEKGYDLLRHIHTIPLVVAHCAYQHHEKLDGTGYPRGIKGKDIHFLGRLLAVADVYDAVTANRVYRKAMLPSEGMEILYAGAGTHFEVAMIEAFRRAIAMYPTGMTVELSDGRRGIVARQNTGMTERPVIRILNENEKELAVDDVYELDLKNHLSLTIVSCDIP